MIKVKLKYIFGAIKQLEDLLQYPLPSKVHYDLSKALKKMRSEVEIYQKTFQDKQKQYGSRVMKNDIETPEFKVKPENEVIFIDEMNALVEEEIEININPISFNSLGIKDENEEQKDKYKGIGNPVSHLVGWLIID